MVSWTSRAALAQRARDRTARKQHAGVSRGPARSLAGRPVAAAAPRPGDGEDSGPHTRRWTVPTTSDDERDPDLIAVQQGPQAAIELSRPARLDRERSPQAGSGLSAE